MEIINSNMEDLDSIFYLFSTAINYQKKKGYNLWPEFSRKMIEEEITEKRHWKIIEDRKIICIFSVVYSDPIIWGEERNKQAAVYLHRITINPEYKGKGMMKVIRKWALDHAAQNNK